MVLITGSTVLGILEFRKAMFSNCNIVDSVTGLDFVFGENIVKHLQNTICFWFCKIMNSSRNKPGAEKRKVRDEGIKQSKKGEQTLLDLT